MNQEQALNVLVSAVKVAQSRGAFSLEEAEQALIAIRVFSPQKEQQVEETVEDAPKKLKK